MITISRSLERAIKSTGERIVNKPKNGQTRKLIMNKELYEVLYSYYLDRKMNFNFKMNEYVFGVDKPLSDTTITSRKINIVVRLVSNKLESMIFVIVMSHC